MTCDWLGWLLMLWPALLFIVVVIFGLGARYGARHTPKDSREFPDFRF